MSETNHKSKGYKPSPIGLIPDDWDAKELSKLFEFKNGINASKESYGSGVKFINVMEVIYNDRITPQMIPGSVSITNAQKEMYLVKTGDVLFNRTSETTDEIGLTAVYEGKEEVVFGGFVIRGRAIDGALKTPFKRYCFRSKPVRDQIVTRGQGAVRSNIGQGDLEKVVIPIPPHEEQTAIAELLGTWDRAINSLTQLIAQKELHKKWLTQRLLTGKKRLKGFKDEWREFHLGDFFDERNEINQSNLPLLSIGQSGVYPQSESDKKDNSNEDKSKYRRIRPGDIGYNTMRMWQGRSALSKLDGIVSPAYTILKPKKNADPLFFSYLFKTPKLIHSFFRNSQGLVEDTLNCKYKDFAIVKAHLPQKDEQAAIARIIFDAEKELILLNRKVEFLKTQKRGLMQILLTGKKRLKIK